MDFSTHCCAKRCEWPRLGALALAVVLAALMFWPTAASAQTGVELRSVSVESSAEGLVLDAQLALQLGPQVEDALKKGVSVSFVAEASVLRERWYWYDKQIANMSRRLRLSFHPLTGRWRLTVSAGEAAAAQGASLSQSFEQLSQALAAVGRISSWLIAEVGEIDADEKHAVSFRFRLDTTQLPRPMQIGIGGQPEWSLSVQRSLRVGAR